MQDSAAALRSFTRDGAGSNPLPPPRYPWKTRIAVPIAIVVALLALVAWSARNLLLPATDVRVVPVVMQPAGEAHHAGAQTGKGDAIVQAAGWIEPDPYAIAAAALTDGTVGEILVLEGQAVKSGDTLVRLIDDDAKLALARAEAELAKSQADLDSAQRTWDHPIHRDREVLVTAAMVDEAKAELTQLTSEIAAEEAREKDLADQLRRLEPLASAQSATEQELKSTRFKHEAQVATLAAMKAKQPKLEALLRVRAAEAKTAAEDRELRIDDKRALDLAKASLKLAEAALSEAQLRLKRTEVRAPADGVVMTLLVERGSKLMFAGDMPTSAYVARLYDPNKLQVRVDVPLADAQKIEIGGEAEIYVESVPGRIFKGVVTRAVHQADISKNTLQFKVRLTETAAALKPEMLARVRFLPVSKTGASTSQNSTGAGSHLPFIPESLVRSSAGATQVFIVDRAANVARLRTVTLGSARRNGWIAVTSGLSAGDILIAEPAGIADNQRVRIAGEASSLFANEGARK
jgi:RND family efflux transporter MFP subunit